MPLSSYWLPITPVCVLVLHFQLQPLHSKPCPASNVFPRSGGSRKSGRAQQTWGTFQGAWALLCAHLPWNPAMAHTVSPTPSKDILLLPSMLPTNTLKTCPCQASQGRATGRGFSPAEAQSWAPKPPCSCQKGSICASHHLIVLVLKWRGRRGDLKGIAAICT